MQSQAPAKKAKIVGAKPSIGSKTKKVKLNPKPQKVKLQKVKLQKGVKLSKKSQGIKPDNHMADFLGNGPTSFSSILDSKTTPIKDLITKGLTATNAMISAGNEALSTQLKAITTLSTKLQTLGSSVSEISSAVKSIRAPAPAAAPAAAQAQITESQSIANTSVSGASTGGGYSRLRMKKGKKTLRNRRA